MADGSMNSAEVSEMLRDFSRIADSLELLAKHSAETYLLTKAMSDDQTLHNSEQRDILREDLDFRREQAAEAKKQQEFFLKLFMGGQAPPTPPAGEAADAARTHDPTFPGATRRRPRHTEPK